MLTLRNSNTPSARLAALIAAVLISALACNIYGVSEPDDEDADSPPPAASDTPLPDPTSEPTQSPDVTYEGISFSFDESIALHVNVETMPAVPEAEGPPWGVVPEHYQFSFVDYVLADTFHQARIQVYPVAEFEAINPLVTDTIAALRDVLESRLAVPGEDLPFLPMWNAAALIQTQIEYLDFENGSGVRYLTQHGQAAWPINNHDLFYTFQGITSDGKYYIAAIMPISNPSLQQTGDDIPGGDYPTFSLNFLTYIAEIKELLEAQPDDSFTPDLAIIDAIFQSFRIE
jgi:hypothetical protein